MRTELECKRIMMSEEQIIQAINGAASLQEALQRVYAGNDKTREDEFFMAVRLYFNTVRGCLTCQLHGQIGKVGNADTGVNSEIADLLIISYSRMLPRHRFLPCMKINFLQAKKVELDNTEYGLITPQQGGKPKFVFHLDSEQYKLLKDCPKINPLKTGLPDNILYDSCSPAITSYGVFYKMHDRGTVNMAFEITQLLRIASLDDLLQKNSRVKCYFDSTDSQYGMMRWRKAVRCCYPHLSYWFYRHFRHCDLLSTMEANEFEGALYRYQIGSLICGKDAIKFADAVINKYLPNPQVGADFKDFVQNYLVTEDQDRHHDGGNDTPIEVDEMFREFGAPKYLLLVNVDEIERRRHIE